MTSSGETTTLELIRAGTRALHERLDVLARDCGATTSLDGYAFHLECLLSFQRILLGKLGPWPQLEAQALARLTTLEHDIGVLRRCGLTPLRYAPVAPVQGAAQRCDMPAAAPSEVRLKLDGEPMARGALYVAEGSRLGNRSIALSLREAGVETTGLSSLNESLEDIRACWTSVSASLSGIPPSARPLAVVGARRAFELVLALYERTPTGVFERGYRP